MVFRAKELRDALFNQLLNNMEDWEQQVFLGLKIFVMKMKRLL